VVPIPLDHEGINDELGNPSATTDETQRVMAFVNSLVDASHPPKARIAKRPRKRIRATHRKVKVKFVLRARDSDASLECKLDKHAYKACGSHPRYKLRRGKHRFSVRALGQVLGKDVGAPGETRSVKFRIAARR
jgi:hypothetical protein